MSGPSLSFASMPADNCPMCGGTVSPQDESIFARCPHCGSTLYVEAHTLYPRTVLVPAVTGRRRVATLILDWAYTEYGWRGVKVMQRILQGLKSIKMQYFPVWAVHTKRGAVHVQPAAVTAISELWKLSVEAQQVADAPDMDLPMPEVPSQAALAWLSREGVSPSIIAHIGLVFVPVYVLHDEYEGEPITLVVEAATGRLLIDYPPANLGLSWNTISYLSYGALLLTGILASFADPSTPALETAYGIVRRIVTSVRYPSWAIGAVRWGLFALESVAGPLCNALPWLVVVLALIMVFSGRWKLRRWWRSRRRRGSPLMGYIDDTKR